LKLLPAAAEAAEPSSLLRESAEPNPFFPEPLELCKQRRRPPGARVQDERLAGVARRSTEDASEAAADIVETALALAARGSCRLIVVVVIFASAPRAAANGRKPSCPNGFMAEFASVELGWLFRRALPPFLIRRPASRTKRPLGWCLLR